MATRNARRLALFLLLVVAPVAATHAQQAGPDSPLDDDVPSPAVRALWSLGASDQELLMLIAWDGLSRAEAAEALRISVGTLAVRLHRARRRLAKARAATSGADPASDRSNAMEAT